jgi:hypothetical protein
LFAGSEKSELWLQYENLILSCLRTGDEHAARRCLQRLVARFGEDNERVQALRGLVKEAEAKSNSDLEGILKEYDQILGENDTNIVRNLVFSPRPACLLSAQRLTTSAAYCEEADRALAVHGARFRRNVSPCAAARVLTHRCRSVV